MDVWGIRPGGRSIAPAPLYHSAPNSHGIIGSEELALLVLEPRFDAERLLAAIDRHRLTNAYMVPTMFARLLALPAAVRAAYDTRSLEHVIITGAPCPPALREAMIDWWGPVIHETYACSELGTVTFCTAREWLDRPGTVGRPAGEAVVRILDEAQRPIPAGQIGTIYARQPDFPDFEYINNAEARAAAQAGDVATAGDVGWLDEAGYLFIADRRTDLILSGGANIYPAEIEAALMAMPGVADCAVFGVPDPEYGQRVVAHVQPEPGGSAVTPEAVSAFLAARLARFKLPRQVVMDAALPRDANGKIFKRKLQARYGSGAG
jgi:long-chain acyl-CoA synthetase